EEVILFDGVVIVAVALVVLLDRELTQRAGVARAQEPIDGEPSASHEAMLAHGLDGVARAGGAMLAAGAIDAGEMLGVEAKGQLDHLAARRRRCGRGPRLRGAVLDQRRALGHAPGL